MIKTHSINTMTAEVQLRAALHITDHDISENRWGRLSRSQKRRLATEEALLSGILLGFILALSWPLTQVNLQAEAWHSDPGIVIWLLLLIALLCMVIWQLRQTVTILSKGQVRCVRARFKRDFLNGAPYIIAIPQHQFKVNRAVYQAFVDQADYTFYYVPTLNRLVAAEEGSAERHEKEAF